MNFECVLADTRRIGQEYAAGEGEGDPEIEPRILPLVAALRGLGFNTTGSCQGHATETEFSLPYIIICSQWYDDVDGDKDFDVCMTAWKEEVQKLESLIEEFYRESPRPSLWKIQVRLRTSPGQLILGQTRTWTLLLGLIDRFISSKRKVKVLTRHQWEMRSFFKFLLRKQNVTR